MSFMPGPDPFLAPSDDAVWPNDDAVAPRDDATQPGNAAAAAPQPVYQPGLPPYPQASGAYASAEPLDYVKLDIPGVKEYTPGQAGTVYLTGLNGLFTKVLINGVKHSRSLSGNVHIPMADGSRKVLKVRERITGFPKASLDGRVLYQHPYPPGKVLWVAFLPLINLITPVLIGGILLVLGLHYFYIWLIKRPNLSTAAKVGTPIAISGGLAAFNVFALVAMMNVGSA